MGQNKAGLYVY